MHSQSSDWRSWRTFGLALILGITLLHILWLLSVDYTAGGNSWKQGDWLINSLGSPARRGIFGSALLRLSDLLGTSPLLLLILLQGVVVTLIFVVVGTATLTLGTPQKVFLLLISPGFVVFFWFNDPQGAVRKEILVYLAFLPLIVAAMRGRGSLICCVLSMLAYAMAVASHEGNVFFLPFLWVAMWLVLPGNASIALRVAIIVIPGLLALAGGLYAVANIHVPDPGVICAQIVQRGLDPQICGGAIDYLGSPPEQARMHPGRLLSEHFRSYLLVYMVCLLGFRVLLQGSRRLELGGLAVVASGLAFFPLYILAGDYGRWLNFHVSSLVFVTLIALLKFRPSWLYERPNRLDYACVLALSLVIGISHSPGELIDGFLATIARGVYHTIF